VQRFPPEHAENTSFSPPDHAETSARTCSTYRDKMKAITINTLIAINGEQSLPRLMRRRLAPLKLRRNPKKSLFLELSISTFYHFYTLPIGSIGQHVIK